MMSWIMSNQMYLFIGTGFCIALGIAFKYITELRLRKQKKVEDAASVNTAPKPEGK